MTDTTGVLILGAVEWACALLYLWVARIVLRRSVEPEGRQANAFFALWWVSLGIAFFLGPFYNALPVLGHRDVALAVALLNAFFVLLVAGVWGLVSYLSYLYSGSGRWFLPLGAFYVLLGGGMLYLIAWMGPTGFSDAGVVTFQRQQLTGVPAAALGLCFSVPVILAALGYGGLFFRVKEPVLRYRIGLVSGAFLFQFGWSMLSSILGFSRRYPDSMAILLASDAVIVLAALAIVWAYRPPRFVQRRLGLPVLTPPGPPARR